MSRVIVTGDTHGEIGIHRLSNRFSPPLKELGEGGFLVICGDFGLVWDDPQSNQERYWLRWLSSKPFDILFVDGNHENHDLLEKLPRAEMFGGVVGVVAPGVYHLRRGQLYEIAGYTFLAMGGAHSTDRDWREPRVSWWPGEVPDESERAAAMRAARAAGSVDFVVTHEAPRSARDRMLPWLAKEPDEYSEWLDGLDAALDNYICWFFGHHHVDRELPDGYVCTFERLYEIGVGWLETPHWRYLDIGTMPEPAELRGYTAGELAMYAGIPVAAMESAVEDALVGETLAENDDGERLVSRGDIRRIERWLERYGTN